MRLPALINRPESPRQLSTEKAGASTVAAGSAAALALWVAHLVWPDRVPSLVPDDLVLPAAGTLLLAAVSWRGRQKRGEESGAPRPARLHPDLGRRRR